ncbi:hypothetical protein AA0119_g10975 [Alternaria tenuissima]|uniref:Uncharacterized protein n=1 Tax=Alternaria tenuissima TaxID=119927 RepID=A0ABY0FYZ8_9PLEO|nr:hypothetical protein AA0119_g10975 [Alternaria tenuissima]RYO07103.1 hypothetical protein AA0121_g11781 [Alternaria tenuissima]
MTPPNPTTTSSKRRRPVYMTFADGSRGRIDPPPPPGPTRTSISLAELEEICASWDFPRWGDQLPHTLGHAEHLLYDTSTGPWEDERD